MTLKKFTSFTVAFIVAATAVLFLFCPMLNSPAMAAGQQNGHCAAEVFSSFSNALKDACCMGTPTALFNNIASILPDRGFLVLAVIALTALLGALFKKILQNRFRLDILKLYFRLRYYLAYHKPILHTKFARWLALLEHSAAASLAL